MAYGGLGRGPPAFSMREGPQTGDRQDVGALAADGVVGRDLQLGDGSPRGLEIIASGFAVSPQMLEGHAVGDGGKLWTPTLRPGLVWHATHASARHRRCPVGRNRPNAH